MRSMQKKQIISSLLFLNPLSRRAHRRGAGYIIFSLWDLPEVNILEQFKPSITSRVYSDNNKLLAEFFLQTEHPWFSQRYPIC